VTTVVSADAEAAGLLSRWWSRPLSSELAVWDEAWPLADEVAGALGLERADVDRLAGAREGPSLDELLDEYERLFVGPGRTPCPPYESLWLPDQAKLEQGRLMGSASAAVTDLYRDLRLDLTTGAHELPDHIAVEWEALAYALRSGEAYAAGVLLDEHLRVWLPGFCDAVQEHARVPFYSALAAVTLSWTDALGVPHGP
jgi:TorA maturation chaperone TorD